MLVYRIILTKYANALIASGRAARWNPNEVDVIYTASSRSLACLENVVHRTKLGLTLVFSILTIEIPDSTKISRIKLTDLPQNWDEYEHMSKTQALGTSWINSGETAVLEVPSSIVNEEVNYLINPKHKDFAKIKIVKTQPFVFDSRIKL